jgi:hypothetical protein
MANTESTRATSKDGLECSEIDAPRSLSESCVMGVTHILKGFGRLLTNLNTTTSATS